MMFDKLNTIVGIARPIQNVVSSQSKLILTKWQPASSMSITVVDLEQETPHGELLKEYENGEIVITSHCHSNTLITSTNEIENGIKNTHISCRSKFTIWNLDTLQQVANIDFLDLINGYDFGNVDVQADLNCLVITENKFAISFDMRAWDEDDFDKGRLTLFWTLDTSKPKVENICFDASIKFPDGAPGSIPWLLWDMFMNDRFFCNLIKNGQFHIYDMENLSSEQIGKKIEFTESEARGTFKLVKDKSPNLVVYSENILKLLNVENCQCTLQVDFTSYPDILNRGNLELLYIDEFTWIPFFLQRQRNPSIQDDDRDPSTQDDESPHRGIKKTEEYLLIYVTLEGTIVDAIKMNFNIGDYDDGSDEYDYERMEDEQRRFFVKQSNGAIFIISTYNVFNCEN